MGWVGDVTRHMGAWDGWVGCSCLLATSFKAFKLVASSHMGAWDGWVLVLWQQVSRHLQTCSQ